MYCNDGEYNVIGAIWFQTPEQSVRSLLHDPPGSHKMMTLGIFSVVYFLLNCWTYGLSISAGVFIPTLLTGAAFGRFFGTVLATALPEYFGTQHGKYALLGAAAMLGGVVRMTISLTIILIEATGNLTYGFPIMVVLMVAKWVGDFFNEGLYDIHIQLAGVPLLGWEPPPLSATTYASGIMSYPVVVLSTQQKVGEVMEILKSTSHNGFPVVDNPMTSSITGKPSLGKLRGLILRSELIIMIQNKIYTELYHEWEGKLNIGIFRHAYPRYPDIDQIQDLVTPEERQYTLDLRPVMNPTPPSIVHATPLPQVFQLFRAIGLRHLIVTNDESEVVGMVTRKDLARYKVELQDGRVERTTMHITEQVE